MEMQMTFGAGLESLAQRTTTKKQEYDARKADTVWERVERRRRCAPPPPPQPPPPPARGGLIVRTAVLQNGAVVAIALCPRQLFGQGAQAQVCCDGRQVRWSCWLWKAGHVACCARHRRSVPAGRSVQRQRRRGARTPAATKNTSASRTPLQAARTAPAAQGTPSSSTTTTPSATPSSRCASCARCWS